MMKWPSDFPNKHDRQEGWVVQNNPPVFPLEENGANDIAEQFIPSREQIDRLQSEMAAMPQAELVTEHHFSPGMYMRKVFRSAGTVIVGKVHKEPHFFLCTMGEIVAWTEKGMITLRPGDVIESKPGTKRVTMAVVDSIGVTIHRTDKTDLDEIEAELIEPDTTALFDARNNVKTDLIEGVPS